MKDMLSPEEVAERFGVQPMAVEEWLHRGDLRGFKIGRHWRVKEIDIQEFLAKDFFSAGELSRFLGIPAGIIEKWIKEGRIPGAIVGNQWHAKKSDVQAVIDKGIVDIGPDGKDYALYNPTSINSVIRVFFTGEIRNRHGRAVELADDYLELLRKSPKYQELLAEMIKR